MAKVYVVYEGCVYVDNYGEEQEIEKVMGVFENETKAIDYMCNESRKLIDEDYKELCFTKPIKKTPITPAEDVMHVYAISEDHMQSYYFKYTEYELQ